jgi:WD40 repeat protein
MERALLFESPVTVLDAAWTPSGLRLAVAGKEKAVEVWDAATRSGQISPPKPVLDVPVVLSSNNVVALSPDGGLLAIAGGPLRLWDVTTAQELFPRHWRPGYWSVAFAPDSKTLAAGSQDGTVTLWDVSTRPHPTQRHQYRPHQTAVTMLVFSPDGKDLLSCARQLRAGLDWDNRIAKLCEVATGQERGSILVGPSNSVITNAAFSPDGRTLALAHGKPFNYVAPEKSQLLDATNLKELASRSIPAGGAFAVAFSPDGTTLAMGEKSGVVRLWQVDDAKGQVLLHERAALYGHRAHVRHLWFAPDGKVLVSASADQTVKVWQLPPQSEPALLTKQEQPFRALALAPNGRTIATTDKSRRLGLWDLTPQQQRGGPPLSAHFEGGCIPAFDPDSKLVAVPQSDGTVKVWEVATGQLQATLKGHKKVVNGTAFRPHGQLLATASRDNTVKFWDVRTGQEQATLRGHTAWVWSVAFTPDGRTLASGDNVGKVKFRDVDTKQCRITLDGPGRTVKSIMALAFTPDGKMLAAGTYDGHLKLWDLTTGKEYLFPRRHVHAIVSAAFTPDGQTLLTGSKDGTIKFWDVVTKQDRFTLKGHTDQVHGIALTADGETLVSVSEDGTIRVWHAPRATTATSRP